MATPKTPKPKQGNGSTTRLTDGRRKQLTNKRGRKKKLDPVFLFDDFYYYKTRSTRVNFPHF